MMFVMKFVMTFKKHMTPFVSVAMLAPRRPIDRAYLPIATLLKSFLDPRDVAFVNQCKKSHPWTRRAMSTKRPKSNNEEAAIITNNEEAAIITNNEEAAITNNEEAGIITNNEDAAIITNNEEAAITNNEEEPIANNEEAAITNNEEAAISNEPITNNEEAAITNNEEAAISNEPITNNEEAAITNNEEAAVGCAGTPSWQDRLRAHMQENGSLGPGAAKRRRKLTDDEKEMRREKLGQDVPGLDDESVDATLSPCGSWASAWNRNEETQNPLETQNMEDDHQGGQAEETQNTLDGAEETQNMEDGHQGGQAEETHNTLGGADETHHPEEESQHPGY